MKTKRLYLLAVSVAAMFSLSSCEQMVKKGLQAMMENVVNHDYKDSEKWGKVITVPLNLGEFKSIDVTGTVRVVYTQDTVCHVTAYGNEKAIEKYDVIVEDGDLTVTLKDFSGKINRNTPAMTVYVSAPTLKKLEVSGAGDVDLENKVVQAESLSIKVKGAGDIDIDSLEVKDLDLEISGAGDVDINWMKAEDVSMEISGAGDLNGTLIARDIEAEVSGAGDIDLNVDCRKVKADVKGAGDIILTGKCKILQKSSGKASNLDVEGLEIAEE